MLIITLIISIIILAVAIVLLHKETAQGGPSREQFLSQLEKLTEAPCVPIDGQPNCFRISFDFEKQKFIFEDIEEPGFKGNVFKAYLKTQTNTQLSLNFTEKKRNVKIRSDVLIASDIQEPEVEEKKLHMPKALEKFDVHSNDLDFMDTLLKDKKFVRSLIRWKNVDDRGFSFLPIKIINGVIILEFYPVRTFKPSREALKTDTHTLEDYLDQLRVIVDRINFHANDLNTR